MKKFFLFSLLSLLISSSGNAQGIPLTDLYMFQLATNEGELVLTKGSFLSAFNPSGYNNQPAFFSENNIYVTVQTKNGVQTEIYALNPDREELTRVTDTPESEYSPTVMPDNRHFSVVRVDADNSSVQRLWKYPMSRANSGSVLLENMTNIGYHTWLNQNEVLLFLVSDPNELVIADLRTGQKKYVARNPGRCFKKLSNGNVAIVHKSSPESWFIKEMDSNTGELRTIIQTLGGSEDFVILQDGTFLMARGSKLYRFKEGEDNTWKLVTDLNGFGIQSVTRMAVSRGGRLVLVAK